MMRINIATGPMYPLPPVRGGAMARMWWALAPEFARRGHFVTLIARAYIGQAPREQRDGVAILRVGGFDQSTNVYWNLCRDAVDAFRLASAVPDGDVLIVNDVCLPWFARARSGRVVISANRAPKWNYSTYRSVAMVAAASSDIARRLDARAVIPGHRIRILPNAYDSTVFFADAGVRREAGLVVYVGRIHPEKGIDRLIGAAARLAKEAFPVRVVAVGPVRESEGGGGQAFLEQLKRQGDGLDVTIHGPEYDPTRLADWYRRAAVFCYPTRAVDGEALPIAPLEAMACGAVPVVADLPCFDDYLAEGATGYRFPVGGGVDEIGALGSALKRALLDPDRDRMSAAAIGTADRFSITSVASAWLVALSGIDHGSS